MPTDDSNPWDGPATDDVVSSRTDQASAAPVRTDSVDSTDAPGTARPSFVAPAGPDDERADQGDGAEAIVGDDEGTDAEDRRRILVIAALALVAIAALAFFLTRDSDDESADSAGSTSTTAGPGAGLATGSGAGAAPVAITGTVDPFTRADTPDGLGDLPNGVPWELLAGGFAIKANEATLPTPTDDRSFAVVGLGYPDGQAQVRMSKVVDQAGLAFRVKGPFNYFAVVASPEVATWNVVKVVDGKSAQVGNTEQSPVADGTTVGVVLEGDQIQVVVNGRVAGTFNDPDLAGVGQVGLTAKGPAAALARWDDFVGGGPEGKGIISDIPGGGGEGGGSTTAPAEGAGGGEGDGGDTDGG